MNAEMEASSINAATCWEKKTRGSMMEPHETQIFNSSFKIDEPENGIEK